MSDQTSLEEHVTPAPPASPAVSKGIRSRSRNRRGTRPETVSPTFESHMAVEPATLEPEAPSAQPTEKSTVATVQTVSSVRRRRPRRDPVNLDPGEAPSTPPNGTAEPHAALPAATIDVPVAAQSETTTTPASVAPKSSQLRRRPVGWTPPARLTPGAARPEPAVTVTDVPTHTPAQLTRRGGVQRGERNVRASEAPATTPAVAEHRNGSQLVARPSGSNAQTTRSPAPPRSTNEQAPPAIHYREDELTPPAPNGPEGAVIYHVGQATQLQGDPESRNGARRSRGRDRFGSQTPTTSQLHAPQPIAAIETHESRDTRKPEAEPVQGPSGELALLLRGMEERYKRGRRRRSSARLRKRRAMASGISPPTRTRWNASASSWTWRIFSTRPGT